MSDKAYWRERRQRMRHRQMTAVQLPSRRLRIGKTVVGREFGFRNSLQISKRTVARVERPPIDVLRARRTMPR